MKVTQEKLPASQLGLEIEITPEMSKQAYEKTIRDFSRSLNIPGFRKGKVPRHVLIQRLGPSRIKMAVLEDLVETGIRQAIEQEKIEALGNFQLRSSFEELAQQFEPGSPLTFSAAVDVPPDVEIKQYSGLTVQAEEIKHQESRVDEVLEDYRNRTATLIPVEDRPAQMGDVAQVDFSGTYTPAEGEEPVEIPGGSAQDFQIELKEGQFIEGFIEGVVGMSPSETKDVSVRFPDTYPQEDVAGKPAVFSITLKELKEKELPELDDDFAQEISEFETLSELRETLEKRYRDEAEQKTKENKTTAILEALVQQLEVEIPETMIRREVDFLITQTLMRLENQGLDIRKTLSEELLQSMRDRAQPDAIERLQRTLALGEIAKRESIEVSEEALEAKVQEFMQGYPEQNVDPNRLRQVLKDDLLEEKVLEWLEANNTIELVPEGSLSKQAESTDEVSTEADAELETASKAEAEASPAVVDVVAELVIDEESIEAVAPAAAEADAEPVAPSDASAEVEAETEPAKKSSSSSKSASKTAKSSSTKGSTKSAKSSKTKDASAETKSAKSKTEDAPTEE